jgi:endonuclease/exonuclease/phosphatase family metal-dependent hydrolase
MKKTFFSWRLLWGLAAAIYLVFVGCSCSEANTEEGLTDHSIVLLTWNVHNLFDGEDNGFEYNEFLQSAGWSTEKYLGRINSISAAINSIEPQPDIILFQEIESLGVLQDLANSLSGGYSWNHFTNNPGAALGIGILSRLPLSDNRVHSITIGSDTTPRPVLETRIDTDDGAFVIFSCHWKSKVGGEDETENVRKASARVILRRIRELWEVEPELGIIVAGDLNENHDDFYRRGTDIICALLPDDPYAALVTGLMDADEGDVPALQKDFFVLSKNKPPSPAYFPQGTISLFSPWMDELENGSYYFRNNWEAIDHFLLSDHFFNDAGWEYEKTMVLNCQVFANHSGLPIPYNPRTGAGLSDHLPLLLVLKLMSY